MANPKVALSFDEMIQADRKKRKAEQLAAQIFSKNRRANALSTSNKPAPGAGSLTSRISGGSLASRVGVNKRLSSTGPANRPNGRQAPSRPSQLSRQAAPSRPERNLKRSATDTAVTPTGPASMRQTNTNGPSAEITIRGAAGPYCVVASNFAPGTTAADIESVMLPIGGDMAGCRLIASAPTVIAEMLFLDKTGAERVIEMFNNKRADGRLLYVYMKEGASSQPRQQQNSRAAAPVAPVAPVVQEEDVMMEVDDGVAQERQRNDRAREVFPRGPRADRGFRDSYGGDQRRAEPAYQDGRYGFSDGYGGRGERRGRYRDEGRMYSDNMGRGRDGQSYRP